MIGKDVGSKSVEFKIQKKVNKIKSGWNFHLAAKGEKDSVRLYSEIHAQDNDDIEGKKEHQVTKFTQLLT